MKHARIREIFLTLILLLVASAGPALADVFPSKPVTLVVGLGAGGNASAVARLVATELEKKWGQPVVVDFKPGAGGLIAADYVARAPANGYTLLFMESAVTTFALFNKSTTFNPTTDLAPVSKVVSLDALLYAPAKLGARNFDEFVAKAKANPGKLNFAVLGPSGQLLDILKFNSSLGLQMEEISYKGVADVITGLLANDVHLYSAGYASMKPYVDKGQLVPIAVMGEKRIKELPDVPTLRERNIDYVSSFWYGVWAPPTTDKALLAQISNDIRHVVSLPELRAALEARALTVLGSSPEVFRSEMEEEIRIKRAIAAAANIQPK